MHRPKLVLNLLVLITVIGLVLTGWLAGHILRHTTPVFQHPPIEESDPHIKIGYEFEGIRRIVVLPGTSKTAQLQVYLGEGKINLPSACEGTTYYTSLPAKCHTADGRLVQVGPQGEQLIYLEEK